MRRLLTIIAFLMFQSSFYSCNTSSKLIYKYKTEKVNISVFESSKPEPRLNRYEFYVKVDSSSLCFYYIFYPNNIYKLYENNTSLVYSLTYENKPMVLLNNLDTFVLDLASKYIDSLGKKNLQFKKGATGFMEEIRGH